MNTIEILMQEHERIREFIKVVRKACCRVLEGEKPDTADFRDMARFMSRYADNHHHKKEEDILYKKMMEECGPAAEQLIRSGMLVEHDMGRFHRKVLEEALNRYDKTASTEDLLEIVVNAGQWCDLLTRHVDKEDQVVYPFGKRALRPESMAAVDRIMEEHEALKEVREEDRQYLSLLKELEKKY